MATGFGAGTAVVMKAVDSQLCVPGFGLFWFPPIRVIPRKFGTVKCGNALNNCIVLGKLLLS